MGCRLALVLAIGMALSGISAGANLAEAGKQDASFSPFPTPLGSRLPRDNAATTVEAIEARQNKNVPPVWGDPRHPPPTHQRRSEADIEIEARQHKNVPPVWGDPRHPPPPTHQKRSEAAAEVDSGEWASRVTKRNDFQKRRCRMLTPVPPDCGLDQTRTS
ncbi:predicted protein [Uncinocarpus reesii 1704]|uniref:Uncharacterized protein n=1 Tax=Uncinocarpus reesii (strain UAMH 1704) TaxID=336963 RepID=C4JPW7_UNCRE|nr:uncharacterized protein UREG_04610 [Uncinocarpus reesii 1704]EEP79764.1 predicted protein [Uncinocarpus reesii 1704]